MKIKKKNFSIALSGCLAGFINGLLGTGGGIIIVPLLDRQGLQKKESHATSIAVILPLSVISTAFYLGRGSVSFNDVLPYLPGGVIGAVIGTFLMTKIKAPLLRKIFAALIIVAGIRLVFR